MKKILFVLLKALISGSLLYFVLKKAGISNVISTVKTIKPAAFIFAVFAQMVIIFVASLRWKLLLPASFKTGRAYSLYLIGAFFNNFLPGIVGGDAIKAYYIYKETGDSGLSLASVFMDRYMGFMALMALGVFAFPIGLKYLRGTYVEWFMPVIVFLFLLVSFIIFGLKLGRKIKFLSVIYDYFQHYRNQKKVIVKAFVISILVHALLIIAVYTLTRGLGQDISLAILFVFVPIITSISTIPISIFGIGLRESSFVFLFGFLGISPAIATAVSFSWLLSLAAGSLPGAIEYLRYKKSNAAKK